MHMSISFYVLCLLCSFYHVIVAAKGTRGCKSFAIVWVCKNSEILFGNCATHAFVVLGLEIAYVSYLCMNQSD